MVREEMTEDAESNTVLLESIPRWSTTTALQEVPAKANGVHNHAQDAAGSKFPFNEAINNKIRIWKGEAWRLKVDAIVNPSNETLSEVQGISGAIVEHAGNELLHEIEKLDGCRTGEAKIANGHALPARHIIFTVGPRYNPKYQTAAENALHSSYRSCMQIAKEYQLTSLAFTTIHSEIRGYPPENGAHIALRTIRRFLEKHGDNLDVIVLSLERLADFDLYQRVLPLYFPRSKEEERKALALLPADTGDENGETVIEERKIRINTFAGADSDDEGGDESAVPLGLREVEEEPSPTILAGMQGDLDEEKRRNLASKTEEELEKERTELLYSRYLRKAREEDLSDIARRNIFYRSGVDHLGRPVYVLVGIHLPRNEAELESVLAYILRVLNPNLGKDFVVVYLHAGMSQEMLPDLAWLRKLHDIFEYKFAKNMRVCYIIHPTFWLKVMAVILSPFITSEVTDKLRYMDGLAELLNTIDLQHLNIPNAVFQYDTKSNGHAWQPSSPDSPDNAL